MNGNRYLFDTNAIIYLLQGNTELIKLTQQATWIGISIISKLEFLSFPELSAKDARLYHAFERKIDVIGLENSDSKLHETIIKLRSENNVKLPDAIIASTAMSFDATLVSADKTFCSIAKIDLIHSFL